jgi:hypothetical protein
MPNTIVEVTVGNFAEYIAAIEEARTSLEADELWYRGVSKDIYWLTPSLFRNPSIKNIDDAVKIEQKLYNEYSFRSPPYDSTRRDIWDLLFLMQHYRAPTRLLDWTASPLVALFFATARPASVKENAVVWVIDPARWNSGVLHDISQEPEVFSTNDDMLKTYHPTDDSKSRRSAALAVEGIINNPRINAQKGKFIVFGHQLKSMEAAAQDCPVWVTGMPMIRINCKFSAVPSMSKSLSDYGMTYTSIYPDLEGLAAELKIKHGFDHV